MKQVVVLIYLFSLFFYPLLHAHNSTDVVIENRELRLLLARDGKAKSLIHKRTGQECLDLDRPLPAFSITENRPYATELMLTYTAKCRTYPSNRISREGEKLMVYFEEIPYMATIELIIRDDYIAFSLIRLDYTFEKIGVERRRTEIDRFTLLQLPVKKRAHFGEWLNVAWDNDVAVNLLATNPFTEIDATKTGPHLLMSAAMDQQISLLGGSVALIVTDTDRLLTCIARVEEDHQMPLGVKSRQCEAYKYSYYEPKGITPENADQHIAYAKQGGFRLMLLYYEDIFMSMGHFLWREDYPNKMRDLKQIVDKIHAAGLIAGFHIHYNKAGKEDAYVTPVPDARLHWSQSFTLASDVNSGDSVLFVEENPHSVTMEAGRRLLKLNREIVSFEDISTEFPYRFLGCKRGRLNTKVTSAEKGAKLGLLDVDTWPRFIRFDQRTTIQDEVAERISCIYADAGFRFLYFDGAEDVHPPYWFHLSNAQYKVYRKLEPPPLFSEGAAKSHFSWHIITRGNAFDVFPPEDVKEATDIHQSRAARYMSESFSSMNFGWNDYLAPSSHTIGMQPDMYEYICSKAAAWDCPIGLFGRLDQIKAHPRTKDNFEVIKAWEEVRISGTLTERQKLQLREKGKEWFLFRNKKGTYDLLPYHQIEELIAGSKSIRAYLFRHDRKTWVKIWHANSSCFIRIPLNHSEIEIFDMKRRKIAVEKDGRDYSVVSVGDCCYLVFDMPEEKVTDLLKKSKELSFPFGTGRCKVVTTMDCTTE